MSEAPPVLPLVVLMTDFGTDDWYVGTMKGVIKTICPRAEIIDLCHNVSPHSIAIGSLMLSASYRYFPAGSIFVAVIDPGVGTTREPILVRAADRWFLAPNNGLLGFLLTAAPSRPECRILSNPEYHLPFPSSTFHGRDIFAPCAAHLANGVSYTQLAPATCELYGRPITTASADRGIIEGNIIHFDHFGNAVTNIAKELLDELIQAQLPRPAGRTLAPEDFSVQVGGHIIGCISRTYGDVDPGALLAYWGSTGHLEIAINRGSAREQLSLQLLDKVVVRPSDHVC